MNDTIRMMKYNKKMNRILFILKRINIVSYIPIIVCLGYVLSIVQKIARFSYYQVDRLYLMEITVEEVLQGLIYLIFIIYLVCFFVTIIFERVSAKWKIFHFILLFIFLCGLWYSQTFYFNYAQVVTVFGMLLALVIFTYVISIIVQNRVVYASKKNNQEKASPKLEMKTIISFFGGMVLFWVVIAGVQFLVEMSNKRFTYIKNDMNECYVIITAYKENLITIYAEIDEKVNEIKIYPGRVHLFSIDQKIFANEFFDKKRIISHKNE